MNQWLRLQQWLVGLTVMALLLFFLLPPTGWLLQAQLRMQVTALPEAFLMDWLGVQGWQMPERVRTKMCTALQKVVERYLNDYQIQLAAVAFFEKSSEEKADRLWALTARFPDEPSLYATVLRYDCFQRIHLNREEVYLLYGEPVPKELPKPKPQDLAAFERIAAFGERLDRDNAYFPMMRAVVLFALRRDKEAIGALQRASQKPHWNDYALDEAKGIIRLYENAFGRSIGSVQLSLYSTVLSQHYSLLRVMARMATYKAIEAERIGRTEEGIAIRRALARCGRLMRTQSPLAIGSLVGIAITAVAASRPGGAPLLDPKLPPEQRKQKRQERYIRYLRQIGQQEEAKWMQAEFKAGKRVREIIWAGQDRSIFGEENLYKTALLWTACLTLLSGALLMFLLWVAAALLTRSRFGQSAWAFLLIGGLWLAFVIHLWKGSAVKTVVAIHHHALVELTPGISWISAWFYNLPPEVLQSFCFGFIAVLPLLIAFVVMMVGIVRGLHASEAFVQGIRQWSLPIACVLFLFYALALTSTAKQESQIESALQQCLQSEGRYYASLVGKKWPD